MTAQGGIGVNSAYRRLPDSFDPRAAFIFEGIGDDEVIGDFDTLNLGWGAAGYEMDRAGWDSALDRLRMVVDDYLVNLRQYNKDLAYLLAAYRDANLAARTADPPPFFDIEPTIDEDVLQAPEFPVPDPPEWGDIPTKANAGFARVEETYAQLGTRYQMLDRVVDDYAENPS